MVDRDLNAGVAHDEVQSKNVSLNSGSHKNPIRVPDNRVFFNDVAGINGTGKTDAKIAALGGVTISN
jgi:hypothetical protein